MTVSSPFYRDLTAGVGLDSATGVTLRKELKSSSVARVEGIELDAHAAEMLEHPDGGGRTFDGPAARSLSGAEHSENRLIGQLVVCSSGSTVVVRIRDTFYIQ